MRKAYIQNYSITTPLGFSPEENFNAILNGKSANRLRKYVFSDKEIMCAAFDQNNIESRIQNYSGKSKQEFTYFEKVAGISILHLLQTSNYSKTKKSLFLLSTTKGNIELLEEKNFSDPSRLYLGKTAQFLNAQFSLANDVMVISNACISGILAIWIAAQFVQNNKYDQVVICGCDIVSEFTLAGFKSFNAISDSICKPYDKKRNGINLGEASACVMVGHENIGKGIEVVSGGSANDANHISGPSRTGEGLFHSLQECLSGYLSSETGFISAHGTATEFNDEMESIAFGRCQLEGIPIHSLKHFFGHTLGAAGVVESVLSFESLLKQTILPSGGYDECGTSVPLNIQNTPRKSSFNHFIKTASGFGGCNAAVLFSKC
jgi:3-oxoacyl-[acyl-carrier-protein] synthase-1